MKKLNVLIVFDTEGTPPKDQDFTEYLKKEDWASEASVVEALEHLGHNVRMLGLYDNIDPIIKEIKENRPDVIFNQMENYQGMSIYEKNMPALFELIHIPYTGCSAAGLMVCKNKAMSKEIMKYHKIKVPNFQIFRKGSSRKLHRKLKFPMVVKPLQEEASIGIAQASFVEDETHLFDRLSFIHNSFNMHAIVEEYVNGRELYIGVLGNKRLRVFPARETKFTNVPDEDPKIVTYKAKWDKKYRKKWGIKSGFADRLPDGVQERILGICKRAYRALNIAGYGRFDIRLAPGGGIYIIEANANPDIASREDFAMSAEKGGIPYEQLIQKIINLALKMEY